MKVYCRNCKWFGNYFDDKTDKYGEYYTRQYCKHKNNICYKNTPNDIQYYYKEDNKDLNRNNDCKNYKISFKAIFETDIFKRR